MFFQEGLETLLFLKSRVSKKNKFLKFWDEGEPERSSGEGETFFKKVSPLIAIFKDFFT
jgi:hypothetical protein